MLHDCATETFEDRQKIKWTVNWLPCWLEKLHWDNNNNNNNNTGWSLRFQIAWENYPISMRGIEQLESSFGLFSGKFLWR